MPAEVPAAEAPDEVSAVEGADEPIAGPEESAPEPVSLSPDREIGAVLTAWATGWSEQRADDYLAAYSARYRPPGGMSRDDWEAQRRTRISTPSFVEVVLTDLEIDQTAADRAAATFTQSYRSDRFSDRIRKRTELIREEGGWRILTEEVLGE